MPIKIVAKKEGFRRAGISHSGSRIYPEDHFTEEQLLALAEEPNLDFSVVDDPPGEQKPNAKKGGK
ncbi:hypothetical protein C4J81_15385 [Deltaproteobacteria bacterium Smac51]|nr:hypothetical protein C4J81_10120 [Deltaproteobacteria bacterium Smac51]UQZ90513.1 hypothetical protein C4J81_15385 [Deltaproteobacteria bacterium Smac51]